MSLSIIQVVFIQIFTSISFSKPNVAFAHTPNWLTKACNGSSVKLVINPDVCLKILQSQKKIVSSTNQIDLSIAIVESGISNGTNTRTYVENMLKKANLDPNLKGVLQKCKSSYDSAIASFQSALMEVKQRDYTTPTYDLLIGSTDNIDICKDAVASKKINDSIISIGIKVLKMYGFIGYDVIDDLCRRTKCYLPLG